MGKKEACKLALNIRSADENMDRGRSWFSRKQVVFGADLPRKVKECLTYCLHMLMKVT